MSSVHSRITLAIALALGSGVLAEVGYVSPLGLVQFDKKVVPVAEDSSNSEKIVAEKTIPASDSSNSEKVAAEKIDSAITANTNRSFKFASAKVKHSSKEGILIYYNSAELIRAEEVECGGPYMCRSAYEAQQVCELRMHQTTMYGYDRDDIQGVQNGGAWTELCRLETIEYADKYPQFRDTQDPIEEDKEMVSPTMLQMALGNTCSPMWTGEDEPDTGCFYNTGEPECGGIEYALDVLGANFTYRVANASGYIDNRSLPVWANRLWCYGTDNLGQSSNGIIETDVNQAMPEDDGYIEQTTPAEPAWVDGDGTAYYGFNAACCTWIASDYNKFDPNTR